MDFRNISDGIGMVNLMSVLVERRADMGVVWKLQSLRFVVSKIPDGRRLTQVMRLLTWVVDRTDCSAVCVCGAAAAAVVSPDTTAAAVFACSQ